MVKFAPGTRPKTVHHELDSLQRLRAETRSGLLCNPCKVRPTPRLPRPTDQAAVSVEDSDGPRAKFVVSRNPEWYSEDGHGEAYACLDSRGLFEAVRDMMVDWARRLPAEEKRCRPQVVYKKIRGR
ncbi:hypothetical protein Q5P01_000131 [Channa striata]|uniref:Uncharacterized protein n=1 Tax=Channa striata TaxID=64152 RepID=A0AA88IFW3_CHASR|nr:hypothetical protein Q5P01_000131 [Channa striata]